MTLIAILPKVSTQILPRVSTQILAKKTLPISSVVRCESENAKGSIDYWLPKPYPKTEVERRKAAEKYGLHPDEYKPYPEGPDCLGDYPQIPLVRKDSRDSFYPWDLPWYKANHGETLNIYDDIEAYLVDEKLPGGYTIQNRAIHCFCVVGVLCLIIYFGSYITVVGSPQLEKQLPKDGVVHYTFEPAE